MKKTAWRGRFNSTPSSTPPAPRRRGRKGQAIVEFALLVFLLMIILMGLIDYARVFHAAVTVADAARAGAQYGARSNTFSGDFAGMTTAAEEDAANLVDGIVVTPVRYCKCQDGTDADCLTDTCPEGAPQIYVEVRAAYTFETLTQFPLLPKSVGMNYPNTIRVQ